MADTSQSETGGRGIARKLLIPALISAVGSLLGYLLSKRDKIREAAPKLREAVSDVPMPKVPEGGVGEITSDLQGKLDEVLGKESATESDFDSSAPTDRDLSKFEERRRARQERRTRRQRKSRS
jgi:hypothetical protein